MSSQTPCQKAQPIQETGVRSRQKEDSPGVPSGRRKTQVLDSPLVSTQVLKPGWELSTEGQVSFPLGHPSNEPEG